MSNATRLAIVMLLSSVCAGFGPASEQDSQSTGIRPAHAAIIEAFTRYRLIAIGEAHRNQQVHDFIVGLLNDPAFLADGGDVVVEFGNAQYQGVIDRYIWGESVARTELVRVWRDTVNILVWDAPVYERVFDTIRRVTRRRSPHTRLRVLLADPPIDWSAIHDRNAWEKCAESRDGFAADAVERSVIQPGRRALLIFGSAHIFRDAFDRGSKPNHPRQANLAERLEAAHAGQMLLVLADNMGIRFDDRTAGWRAPLLVRLKSTSYGDWHVGPPDVAPRLEDLADEFLYLGPTAAMITSKPDDAIYRDSEYLQELIRRDAIQGRANTSELRRLARRR